MIRLEYFERTDFKQLIDWINNEELLINWAGNLFKFPLTVESLDWYLKETNDLKKSNAFVYKAIDAGTGKTVGHVSLGNISKKNRSARISRVFTGDCERGKGICQGMIKSILQVGFEELKLHRISLGVYDINKAAIKCYEKCGLTTEGILRDVLWYKEKFWSIIEMSMLEDEWRKQSDWKE
jgi:RimJ/RimL family protein N-acetyltransferase